MNWDNAVERRAYKAGWMRGLRLSQSVMIHATPLARQVMLNEMERARRENFQSRRLMKAAKKKPRMEGNAEWRELETWRETATV